MFGVTEILETLGASVKREVFRPRSGGMAEPPGLERFRRPHYPRHPAGLFARHFSGLSPMIPTFLIYGIEQRLSKHPEKFGTGVIEGVAAPEACNNAAATAGYVPLFSLGIPSNAFNAILLGAFDDPRASAGADADPEQSDLLLGRPGQHVPGKRHAAGPEPAADPALGQGPARSPIPCWPQRSSSSVFWALTASTTT